MPSRYVLLSSLWVLAGSYGLCAESTCDRAAQTAALSHGVPFAILKAIGRVETGRKISGQFAPWPWSLNVGGRSKVFDTRAAADAAVRNLLGQGIRNFDIGCFQINAYWHRAAAPNPVDLLDPDRNARFAAQLLLGHFEATGDWTEAAGRYHSKTPEFARIYKAKIRDALQITSATDRKTEPVIFNRYPFLRPAAVPPSSPGSLVPAIRDSGLRPMVGG